MQAVDEDIDLKQMRDMAAAKKRWDGLVTITYILKLEHWSDYGSCFYFHCYSTVLTINKFIVCIVKGRKSEASYTKRSRLCYFSFKQTSP